MQPCSTIIYINDDDRAVRLLEGAPLLYGTLERKLLHKGSFCVAYLPSRCVSGHGEKDVRRWMIILILNRRPVTPQHLRALVRNVDVRRLQRRQKVHLEGS